MNPGWCARAERRYASRRGDTLFFLAVATLSLFIVVEGVRILLRQNDTFDGLRESLLGPPLDPCSSSSPSLVRFLDAYAAKHRAWVESDSRLAVFDCSYAGSGGIGDRIKGALSALLYCLLSPGGRGFLLTCDGPAPLHLAWRPRPAGIQWDRVQPLHTSEAGQVTYVDYEARAIDSVARFLELENERFVRLKGNVLFPSQFNRTLWGGAMAAWAGGFSTTAFCPYEVSAGLPAELARLTDPSHANCSQSRTPCSEASTNIAFHLLDWLIAPSPALLQRIMAVASQPFAPRQRQFVVALHLRVGTPDPGASYEDPARDDPRRAVPLAARCADEVARELARRYGQRERILWFVSSDSHKAKAMLRELARGKTVDGVPVDYADVPASSVVHVDRTDMARVKDVRQLQDDYIDTFAEHFLLSAAHGMVRSRSGFSETAQAWGRIPVVRLIDVSLEACRDVSHVPIQTV